MTSSLSAHFSSTFAPYVANESMTSPEVALPASPRSKPWPALKHPLYGVVLMAAAYLLVVVVGVVSNGLVITVVYRQPRMHTVTNYFLANLATADILVCIFVLPITLLDNIFTGIVIMYFHSSITW